MEGVQSQGLVEDLPGPRELFPGQPRIAEADVELDGIGIESEALSKHLEGPVKVAVVVKPVRLFVVFL